MSVITVAVKHMKAGGMSAEAILAAVEEMEGEAERPRGRAVAQARATRIPTDWEPGPDGIGFAEERGLSGDAARNEVDKFRNYWTAKAGKDASKLDWPAVWRSWVLNVTGRHGNGTGNRNGIHSNDTQFNFLAGFAEVAAGLPGNGAGNGSRAAGVPRGRIEIDG